MLCYLRPLFIVIINDTYDEKWRVLLIFALESFSVVVVRIVHQHMYITHMYTCVDVHM